MALLTLLAAGYYWRRNPSSWSLRLVNLWPRRTRVPIDPKLDWKCVQKLLRFKVDAPGRKQGCVFHK